MTRYVVHPGKVTSKTDGDVHFIGFRQLVELAKVPLSACINAETSYETQWPRDAVHIYPAYDGNYEVPKPTLDRSYNPKTTDDA